MWDVSSKAVTSDIMPRLSCLPELRSSSRGIHVNQVANLWKLGYQHKTCCWQLLTCFAYLIIFCCDARALSFWLTCHSELEKTFCNVGTKRFYWECLVEVCSQPIACSLTLTFKSLRSRSRGVIILLSIIYRKLYTLNGPLCINQCTASTPVSALNCSPMSLFTF